MLVSANAMTTHRALAYACVLASIPATMSPAALLTSWLVRRSSRSASGAACARLQILGLRRTTSANQIDNARHDLDEPVVLIPEPAKQLDFILRDELQAIHVVAELVKLAQRARQRPLVGRDQRGGDAVQRSRRVMLYLPISFNLALQLDQFLGALVKTAQNLKPHRPHHDQKHCNSKKSGQQLELYACRYPRNQVDKRTH